MVADANLHDMQVLGENVQVPQNRIREIRTQRGLRLAQIAAPLDVDQSTVYRWEEGANIPDSQKFALAVVLETDVPYLMGWTEKEEAA